MKLKIGSDCSGVGALIQAVQRLKIDYTEVFACDFDFYARMTYILNFGTAEDVKLSKTKEHKYFADNVKKIALRDKTPSEKEKQILIDANEFAKKFSFYYPFNMYEREIPEEPLDLYVSTVPCQSFSLAGKRKGKKDKRGILFFSSLDFIDKNRPKAFIFENVKGLLSDDRQGKEMTYGRTFNEWINCLGGKSINGVNTFFPHEDSVPYHIYFKVMNAKEYGVPQNRERIFIVGIRDDEHNDFKFPQPIPLEKRLKDILEKLEEFQSLEAYNAYMEKYFLSDNMVRCLLADNEKHKSRGNGFKFECKNTNDVANSITTKAGQRGTDNFIDEIIQLNNPIHSNDRVYSDEGISPTLNTMQGGNRQPFVQVKEKYKIGAIRGRNLENPKSIKSGLETVQMLEINENGTSNALTTVQKDNVVVIYSNTQKGYEIAEEEEEDSINFSIPTSKTRRGRVGKGVSQTLDTQCNQGVFSQKRIRRLTERECFRLMNFNEDIPDVPDFKYNVSSTQAYKQAGNSVVVKKFELLIKEIFKIK